MKTKNVQIESDRRCSSEELEKILSGTPVEICGGRNLKVRAHMGLGKIIYLKPIEGYVDKIKVTGKIKPIEISTDQSGNNCLTFFYRNNRFELQYK